MDRLISRCLIFTASPLCRVVDHINSERSRSLKENGHTRSPSTTTTITTTTVPLLYSKISSVSLQEETSVMKVSVFTLFAIIAVAASPAFGAEDSHASHDDSHDDVVDCAAVNVTDLESCAGWCGDNYTATFEPEDEHGDTRDGVHVDFLIGYSCECEEEEPTSTTRADGHSGDDHHDEKHCMMHYELPTCESEGLAMCGEEGDNATTTCSELCVSLGLGTVNDSHICEHVEGEHDDNDHDRWLAEEDDHDGEEGPYTMCFCEAASVGKGTMVCADEGWEEEHHDDHGDGDSSSPMLGGAFASLMLSSALIAFV